MPEVPVYTAAEVRAAELPLLAAGEPLMARASAALAGVASEQLAGGHRVLVLAGRGDNGGDALFAASHLLRGGAGHVEVVIVLTGGSGHAEGLAAAQAAGARVVPVSEAAASVPDLVLDGILGIGTSADPSLRGAAREVVEALLPAARAGATRVIAVDLPSGLQPDTGATGDDVVLPASVTVTFGAVKAGLVGGRGPELCGELVLVDLGLGPGLARDDMRAVVSVDRVIVAPAAGPLT
ncbi:NAD(P)H-hydrate epimerase [Microbacterium sp. BWT-B31]|uniref:NAD(P)H-hydrate epimerase n=1 Tax=Microbacterium sp. BWT-B31 TaxID=3232072 RepID=UPI0035289648